MSTKFEAVVVEAGQTKFLELLDTVERSGHFAKLSLYVYSFAEKGSVIFGQPLKGRATIEPHETEEMAQTLSRNLGKCLAVHYNDQVDISASVLFLDGKIARLFGEEDEVWVPWVKGKLVTDGPRFKRNTVPDDINCDILWSAIDAGLEAAGFLNWIKSEDLIYRPDEVPLIWSRPDHH